MLPERDRKEWASKSMGPNLGDTGAGTSEIGATGSCEVRTTGERELTEKGALKTSEGAPNTSSMREGERESEREEKETAGEGMGGGAGMLKRVGQMQSNIKQVEQ
jgi:hypothetical protein